MSGYTRQSVSQIQDGQVVNAAPVNAEFDTIQTAFSSVSGHKHDGTPSEGAPITALGPTQNVNATATELYPRTNNYLSLGTSALGFKDLFLKGTANLANTAITGTFGVTGNATVSGTLGVTGAMAASTSLTTPTVIAGIATNGYVFTGLGSGFRSPTTGTVEAYTASGNKVAISPTNVTVTGPLVAQNNIAATGAISTASTLAVTGSTTLAGAAALNGGLTTTTASATGNVTIGGTLGVTGNTTLASVAATNVTASGTLGVTGASTLNNVTAANTTTTGVASYASGTASLPSITFTGDANTGIYRPAADQVAVTVGGTQKVLATASAVSVTSPLQAPTGSAAAPSITFTGDTNTGIYSGGPDNISFSAGGSVIGGISPTSLTLASGKILNLTNASIDLGVNGGVVPIVAANVGGTVNNIKITIPTADDRPQAFWFWPQGGNTGPVTVEVNGAAAAAVLTPQGTPLPAGYTSFSGSPQPLFMYKNINWHMYRPDERFEVGSGVCIRYGNGFQTYVQEQFLTEGITTASGSLFVTPTNLTWTIEYPFLSLRACNISFIRLDKEGGVSIKQRGGSSIIFRPWMTTSLGAGFSTLYQLEASGTWY